MQLVASLLLFQAGALAASNAARAPAFPSQFSPAMQLRSDLAPRQTSCDGQECADGCIPLDAMCCDITVGIYCEAGTTCTTRNTCCADGLTCNTDVTNDGSCASDETRCGSSKFLSLPPPPPPWKISVVACADCWVTSLHAEGCRVLRHVAWVVLLRGHDLPVLHDLRSQRRQQ